MKILLLWLAFCLPVNALIFSPLQPVNISQSRHPKQQADKQNPVPQPRVIKDPDGPNSDHESDKKDQVALNNQDSYLILGFNITPMRLNLALTIITFCIAIAAVFQATAAKLSAKAIMRSERAWLLLQGEKIGMPSFMADSTDSTRITVSCYIAFENCGKTPAEAILWVFELTIGDSPIEPPSLEIYTTKVTDKTSGQTPFPIGPGRFGYAVADSQLTGFISPADWDDYCAGKKFAWLCGVARYCDVFKRKTHFLGRRLEEHETRICLVYQKFTNAPGGRWALGGPEGYNRAT